MCKYSLHNIHAKFMFHCLKIAIEFTLPNVVALRCVDVALKHHTVLFNYVFKFLLVRVYRRLCIVLLWYICSRSLVNTTY